MLGVRLKRSAQPKSHPSPRSSAGRGFKSRRGYVHRLPLRGGRRACAEWLPGHAAAALNGCPGTPAAALNGCPGTPQWGPAWGVRFNPQGGNAWGVL